MLFITEKPKFQIWKFGFYLFEYIPYKGEKRNEKEFQEQINQ
ncbi:hypothetical protein F4694_004319 [Bacillus niacini]|uniref:Uncharacterized protein n=1 Tax=Neobacillus niacini TaxID=86668 RepID=A0A852TJV0_9BACI|nr:hypothetical protein [Neobacillus niacini]